MDIITIIVLTGLTNLAFALYSWHQVHNPESHRACRSTDASTVHDLMSRADVLLYDAKRKSWAQR